MENKRRENGFQLGRRTNGAHRLTSLRKLHRDGTDKKMKMWTTYPAAQHDKNQNDVARKTTRTNETIKPTIVQILEQYDEL